MSTGIGSVTPQYGPHPAGGHGGSNPMKQIMSGAASLLGMSDDDLRTALQGGRTSLADLATRKGVSQDDLLAAVTTGVQDVGPPAGAGSADAATVAQRIIDGEGGPPPPGGRHRGGDHDGDRDGDMATRLQSLTSALGMDQTSFFDALKAGSTLSDLASQQNVSQGTLEQLLLGPVSVDTSA